MAVILLLDDDDMLRGLLAETLHAEGHSVIQSDNGLMAFNIAKMGPIDLMITDLFMPRVDGMEAILNARHDTPDVPIIAMSGGGDYVKSDFLAHTMSMGASAILHKPFHLKEFQQTVRSVLAATQPVLPERRRAKAS